MTDILQKITSLMIECRLMEPLGGVHDPADIQWLWCKFEPYLQQFAPAERNPYGCLLGFHYKEEILAELIWRADAAKDELADFLHHSVQQLRTISKKESKTVAIAVREDDSFLRGCLETTGFVEAQDEGQVQTSQAIEGDARIVTVPPDFAIIPRSQASEGSHPLASKNGTDIEEKLRACSLYNPHLDFSIRHKSGDIAGYCLCWFDQQNKAALFEPVRIMDEFQRQGLGKVLLTYCIEELRSRGASLVKVTYEETNPAAQSLYRSVGFRPIFRKLFYEYKP